MSAPTRLEESVLQVVEPLIEGAGYELVELEVQGGKRSVVRLFIDRLEGREPVGIGDCAKVSRLVEPALDAADLIAHAYALEVSSPGVERPLRKPRDFERFAGERAKLVVREADGSKRTISGRILEANEGGFELERDGEVLRYDYEQVERANLEFVFGR